MKRLLYALFATCLFLAPDCGAVSVSPAGPIDTCEGLIPQLTAAHPGATGYQWQLNGADIPGATGAAFTPAQSGTYTVGAVTAGGNLISAPVVVNVRANPKLAFNKPAGNICAGDCDSIVVSSGVTGASLGFYMTGVPLQSLGDSFVRICPPRDTLNAHHLIFYFVSTAAGCADTSKYELSVTPPPFISRISGISVGDSARFAFNYSGGVAHWDFGDGTPDVVTSSGVVMHYYKSGTYTLTLTVTNAAGCSSTYRELVTINSLGVAGAVAADWNIWPNPATDAVFIDTRGLAASASIIDMTGRTIRSFTIAAGSAVRSWPLGDLPSGSYWVQLSTAENRIFRRLSIRH